MTEAVVKLTKRVVKVYDEWQRLTSSVVEDNSMCDKVNHESGGS